MSGFASETVCENRECGKPAGLVCSKCKEKGLSKRISAYCCRECQLQCFPVHKLFHSCVSDCQKKGLHLAWTVSLALKELSALNKLPSLSSTGILFLHFYGSRDGFEDECQQDFSVLHQTLKATLYPDLIKLDILISGIEISRSFSTSTAQYSLQLRPGRAEVIIPTVSKENSVALILQPGLSSTVDSWSAALRLLVEANVPTVITGYSNIGDRLTSDALFDERTLSSHFLADIVVPTTSNPCSLDHGQHRKMAFYFIFQGRNKDPTATAITRQQLQIDNQKAFVMDLIYVAKEFDRNPALSKRCEKVLKLIESGASPFAPTATMNDVDQYLMNSSF